MEKFCYWQIAVQEDHDEQGNQKSWTCTAHLHEGRANECPFKSLKEAENQQCVDAEKP